MSSPLPRALYVEIEPYCVAWLRHLIQRGLIADGDVADFSLTDLRPSDLARYTQVHFCAGIGLWSAALRGAGIPDSRPVWTASLPCQPFSAAGKGDGFADERHLWPEFFHLVEQCRPEIILGEQVASKDGLTWLDLVQSDLEGTGYAVGSVDSCSAGFGAPHIRQRMYWMADADASQRRTDTTGGYERDGDDAGRPQGASDLEGRCVDGELGDARLHGHPSDTIGRTVGQGEIGRGLLESKGPGSDTNGCRPTNGFWHAPDWLYCRDGKWRPVEPGTFPLAHGLPRSMGTDGAELRRLAGVAGLDAKSLTRAKEYRIGTLRAYGNAINLEQAIAFCRVALV